MKNYNLGDLGSLNPEKIHNWYINFKWDISPYELVKIEENIKNIINKRIETEDEYYKLILICYKNIYRIF